MYGIEYAIEIILYAGIAIFAFVATAYLVVKMIAIIKNDIRKDRRPGKADEVPAAKKTDGTPAAEGAE